MGLKWTDTLDIAIELDEAHPDVDPTRLNFVDLMSWVMALPAFGDDEERCGPADCLGSSSILHVVIPP